MKELISKRAAMRRLGVGWPRFAALIANGEIRVIPGSKPGERTLVIAKSIDEYIDRAGQADKKCK